MPDFYQGTELWQFTLVDPDNHWPVDYSRRISMLDTLPRREAEGRIALIRELAVDPARDEMKLFATHKALDFRRSHKELFTQGRYIPQTASDACAGFCGKLPSIRTCFRDSDCPRAETAWEWIVVW